MGLLDILQQYANPSAGGPATASHFEQAAQQVSPQDLGNSIAAAFRSDATPAFGQMIGDLFAKSDPSQRAGILNQIVQSVGGAGGLASMASGVLGRVLGPAAAAPTPPQITPEQASQVSPADAGALATHAQQQDGSIVDMAASFYAQHPALVKSLGASALAIALGHLHASR